MAVARDILERDEKCMQNFSWKTWKKNYGWKTTYRYQDNINMDLNKLLSLFYLIMF